MSSGNFGGYNGTWVINCPELTNLVVVEDRYQNLGESQDPPVLGFVVPKSAYGSIYILRSGALRIGISGTSNQIEHLHTNRLVTLPYCDHLRVLQLYRRVDLCNRTTRGTHHDSRLPRQDRIKHHLPVRGGRRAIPVHSEGTYLRPDMGGLVSISSYHALGTLIVRTMMYFPGYLF
jgi:hypothetical protein